jgi:ech hydrogenase subunit A
MHIISTLILIVLAYFSLDFFASGTLYAFSLSAFWHTILIGVDTLLLLFFLQQGFKYKNRLVMLFALLQIVLFMYVLQLNHTEISFDFIVNELSLVMFLITNIVGGLIVLFAQKYIQDESCSKLRKNYFLGLLLFFIVVMNILVCANSLEIFFLCFELTTLCSYLLIKFRNDEIAIHNALKALWMNQVGGVFILLATIGALYVYDTSYFSTLIHVANQSSMGTAILLPVVFLIFAGYVKGASLPFDSWLLGAMVAPTPVSALLHSATMVNIAPFLVLKLSPTFSSTLSFMVALLGMSVFLMASLKALRCDILKEILGYSTIAILALIMAVASFNHKEATLAALILMVFHSIAKALLFIQAGILERQYGIKKISQMQGLINRAPLIATLLLLGFASLTLPPFAAFIGKFVAIEIAIEAIKTQFLYAFVLILLLLGSVCLTILYFKIATKLLTKEMFGSFSTTPLPFKYGFSSMSLAFLLLASIALSAYTQWIAYSEVIVALFLIILLPLLLFIINFKKMVFVKEYNCAEKDSFEVGMYQFEIGVKNEKVATAVIIALWVVTFFAGVVVW